MLGMRPVLQRFVAVGSQSRRLGIPAQAQECVTYPAVQNGNNFQYQLERDGDVMKPIALFIRTSDPPPPLEVLLNDLGSLLISTSGGLELVKIPIKLLIATTDVNVIYEGCDLTIPLKLDMYFPAVPIIRLAFSSITYTLQTQSSTEVTAVNFLTQIEYYDTDVRREMVVQDLLEYPIQYLKTQTIVTPAHASSFTFQMRMRTLMKGVFLEGRFQDILGVEVLSNNNQVFFYNRQALRMVAQSVREDYVFVPFYRDAAYTDPRTESYVGALYDEEPVTIIITYCAPRGSSTLHALLANNVVYLDGMCGYRFPVETPQPGNIEVLDITTSGARFLMDPMATWGRNNVTPLIDPMATWGRNNVTPLTWTTATRSLNPERSTCPITYEAIAGDFCECERCHHAFDATAFQNYATSRSPVSCPTCRAPWTFFVVYSQPDA
jgi:hypothetical protein